MLTSQVNFLFPDINGSLDSMLPMEFMPEKKDFAMQSSRKNHLEMHRP
jgi:hypothetical protein